MGTGYVKEEIIKEKRVKKNPMKDKFVLKNGGERTKFSSGAIRDTRIGKGRFDLMTPFALLRIARIYEKGAVKYTARNWEKGMKLSVCLDSALRHIVQYLMGMTDEDHLAQAVWNLFACMHTEELVEMGVLPNELSDLPKYMQQTGKSFKKFLKELDAANKS